MGETDLNKILQTLSPELHAGEYVFCTIKELNTIEPDRIIMFFKEKEGYTIIVERSVANTWGLEYTFTFSWITLRVHSSLNAVGLTAVFSKALANANISCNVVAGYYHDHIFVDTKDADTAYSVLMKLQS